MVYASLMGAQVRRKEDPRLITGNGSYVANLKLPGMRHVAFVRSPHAHANIHRIDGSAALRRAGVLAVVTGRDLAPHYEPMPMASSGTEEQPHTHFALSVDRVRYVGEAVAAVIAESPEVAEDALADVVIDWEPLPAVIDLEEAIHDNAPRLFEDLPNNVGHISRNRSGDVEAAFANAYRVVRQRIVSQRVAAVPMEGRAVVVAPDPATGGLTIWNSTQTPHGLRAELSTLLHLPENLIRVIAPDVGGGFGVKIGVYPEDVALAALARLYRMPLRWVETRLENMQTTTQGRGQIAEVEVAVQQDGTITALRLYLVADQGAYAVQNFIPDLTAMMVAGVYRIPAVDVRTASIFTNKAPVAAYRGAGRPEASYYIERMMDRVAGELGIDPAEVRRRNFIPPDKFPYRTATGVTYDSGNYDLALTRALEISHYDELRAEQLRRGANGDRLLGIGLSTYVEICGPGPYESAVVRVEPGGTVTVFTGISPHGQGQETTFAQIVADQIGADYDQIIVRHGDTAVGPMGIGTYGSRGLAVGGMALLQAAVEVHKKARYIAAHILEAAPEDVVLEQGRYQVRGVPHRGLTLAEVASRAYSDQLPSDITSGLEATSFFRPPDATSPFGAHVAVVEIERETGIVHLRNYYSVDDCGKRISPQLVAGQVHGGLAQGISQALWEEVYYDQDGQLLTSSLTDYALPRADCFPTFNTDHTETPTPHNPLGVKGIGEAATVGSTPAIVNAVMDALRPFGVQHLDMPLSPAKVWRAIRGEYAAPPAGLQTALFSRLKFPDEEHRSTDIL